MKRATKRYISLWLVFLMVVAMVDIGSISVLAMDVGDYEIPAIENPQDATELVEISRSVEDVSHNIISDSGLGILTATLAEPVGMRGFESIPPPNSPNEIVEIIVQFVTPPAEALRLLNERGQIVPRSFPEATFSEQALFAHDSFLRQLGGIPMPAMM